MVEFTNIIFDNDWIYADAYDRDFNVNGQIKVHRTREDFSTSCTEKNQFKKAAWQLVDLVNSGKIKMNDKRTIAWG